MNIISDDIVIEHILPYMNTYDIFSCKNISSWWYQRYKEIQDEFLENIIMLDILQWNDPQILYEIERVCGEDHLFDILTFDTSFLFTDNIYDIDHQPLLDALFQYTPFVQYIQKVLKDPDTENTSENELVIGISSYILEHEEIIDIFMSDSNIWTSLLYGTYADRYRNEYESIYPDVEKMVSLIEKLSYSIDAQRVIDGIEYIFRDNIEDKPTWHPLKERIVALNDDSLK